MQASQRLNNRYEILRELGDGGFGKTFLVRDHQMPSARHCVVKQLKPLHENAQVYEMVKERFGREAAILEQLGEHDQVPRLHAYFSENELFYLVEEYIEGDTLTQKVQREGSQSEAAVKAMLLNLLPAIVHVHKQKIVHRDIKPDNIILRQSDQKPVLIDFGAVKETMGTILNEQGNSSRSIVVGTPGYMPSEQMIGRPVYGSDLYSLGLTAIYMLTGKMPQEFETNPTTGAYLWRNYAPNVSDGFAGFLDRAIQVSPAGRFGSAQEMFMALNALVVGVTIPPQSVPYQHQPINQPQYVPQNPVADVQPVANAVPPIPVVSNPSTMPTQAVMPAAYPPQQVPPIQQQPLQPQQPPIQQPLQSQQAAYPTASSGGEWKKPAMVGGIIGLSILIGAVALKAMTNQPAPVATTPAAIASASPKSTPTTKPNGNESNKPATNNPVEAASSKPATPAKPPMSAEEAAKAEAGTDATIVGDAGSKNVRSGPGTKYDSPHSAYPGDRIKVTATTRDEAGYVWHKVYFPKSGAEGWIAAQLLRMDAGITPPENSKIEAPEESEPTPTKSEPAADQTNATIVGEAGSKNIRSGPGTNYDSPHMAYPGDRVKIIDSTQDKGGFTWYKVSFPKSGAEGWIAAQLVKVD